jgi:acyl-coenzyme A thioesterase PaaI-like protein
MKITPKLFKRMFNLYPPYIGAGVKVTYISEDWKELHVSMSLRWFNRNAVGTHFGGSLYSMIDPHLMLLLMKLLGKDYLIWDKTADIEFIKASKKKVTSVIKIKDKDIEDIRIKTDNGEKYLPNFIVEIRDEDNDLVARIKKTIYVRKKQQKQA